MGKEVVSRAIANGEATNPILASVVVTSSDPTKNAVVVSNPDGSSVGGGSSNITQVGSVNVPVKGAVPSLPTIIVDASGNQIVSFGSPQLTGTHWSPTHFQVTYTSASTLTLSGAYPVISSNSQIIGIMITKVANTSTIITNGSSGYSFGLVGAVLTVYKDGVASNEFLATDTSYGLYLNDTPISQDYGLDTEKSTEQSPIRSRYYADTLVDTTNVAAATNYYPASTGGSVDGFRQLSLSGKFIDADGTMTMTVEATNDEDTTNADWIQIYGFDNKNNLIATSWTITNGTLTFAISFDLLNYSYYRVVMINNGATNTAIIKNRLVY